MEVITLEKPKKTSWNKGMKMSPYYCAKLSAIRKNRIITPETCANISKALMGHKLSDETKWKIGLAHLG